MRFIRLIRSIVFSLLRAFADALLRSLVVVGLCVLLGGLAQHLLRDYPMVAEQWYTRWATQAVAVAAPYDNLLSHQGPHLTVSFFSALWTIALIAMVAALGRLPWKMLILAAPLLFVWIGWPLQRLRNEQILEQTVLVKAHTALDQGDLALAVRLAADPGVQSSNQAKAIDLRARLLWAQGDSVAALATWENLNMLERILPGQSSNRPVR